MCGGGGYVAGKNPEVRWLGQGGTYQSSAKYRAATILPATKNIWQMLDQEVYGFGTVNPIPHGSRTTVSIQTYFEGVQLSLKFKQIWKLSCTRILFTTFQKSNCMPDLGLQTGQTEAKTSPAMRVMFSEMQTYQLPLQCSVRRYTCSLYNGRYKAANTGNVLHPCCKHWLLNSTLSKLQSPARPLQSSQTQPVMICPTSWK